MFVAVDKTNNEGAVARLDSTHFTFGAILHLLTKKSRLRFRIFVNASPFQAKLRIDSPSQSTSIAAISIVYLDLSIIYH
jgi:hypothetical protein